MDARPITPDWIRSLLEELEQPLTALSPRQVFYHAVARGLIEATESGYETVRRRLAEMEKGNSRSAQGCG